LIGKTTEEKGHSVYDQIFELQISYFDTKTTFKQRIKVKNKGNFIIIAEIEYMTCSGSKCVLGFEDIEFEI